MAGDAQGTPLHGGEMAVEHEVEGGEAMGGSAGVADLEECGRGLMAQIDHRVRNGARLPGAH